MTEPFLNVKTTAERLHVTERTIRNWINAKRLQRVLKFPGGYRIPLAEVERIEKSYVS